DERVLLVGDFGRRRPRSEDEVRAPVGEIERAGTAGDRVPGAGLEEPRSPRVILRGAGPEDAVLALEPLVGDPGVVCDAALLRDSQLVENRARRLESEPAGAAERPRDVLNDPPVFARLARTGDRFVDLDDAALGGRDDPLVLLVKRTRQHDVGN